MELMYFISGILVAGTTYAIVLLKRNQSNYKDALARLQSHQNISSIRYANLEDEIKTAGHLIADVQAEMEKDQYESVSEINKKIDEVGNMAYKNKENIKVDKAFYEENFKTVYNELQQLKLNVKTLSQDPNMLTKY